MRISVLDHGYVRLVESMGSDLSIVRNARVSYDAAWRAGDNEGSDTRLINYLYKNGHTTPFEAVTFTFEVKAPIFVFRQWHRHRTWTYNELSARYRELPEEFYIPSPELIGAQSTHNKQVRTVHDLTPDELHQRMDDIQRYRAQCEKSFRQYRWQIERGWPRELARMSLPLSTYSHMFAGANLHNLMRFLTLRQHEHAQYEIRVYADALAQLAETIVPVAMAAYRAGKVSDHDK